VACEIFYRELCHLAARVDGDMRLLQRLVDGPSDPADFLVLEAGERVAATLGEEVIVREDTRLRAERGKEEVLK
jgi:hypothetical protein